MLSRATAPMRLFSSAKKTLSVENPLLVQFVHVNISSPQDRFGRYQQAQRCYPEVNFGSNVLQHNAEAKRIMQEQAEHLIATTKQMLQTAANHRGQYEKNNNITAVPNDTIVHVTTPEFFFYPAFALFSQELFEEMILPGLHGVLKELPEWLHCHLGSMPIQITTKRFNGETLDSTPTFIHAVLHGNGGSDANINYYTKNDPNQYQTQTNPGGLIELQTTAGGDPYTADFKQLSTNLPRFVLSRTPSGEIFGKALDICQDHNQASAQQDFLRSQVGLGIQGFDSITSNSVITRPENCVFQLTEHTQPDVNLTFSATEQKKFFFYEKTKYIDGPNSMLLKTNTSAPWLPYKLVQDQATSMLLPTTNTQAKYTATAARLATQMRISL